MAESMKFEAITEADRSWLEDEIMEAINKEFRKEELEENYYKYVGNLQGIEFVTEMSVDELKQTIKVSIDVLEELKNINNGGIDHSVFEKINRGSSKNEFMRLIDIWNEISTKRLDELIIELDHIRRVGGAWAWIIANPGFKNAVCAVYERIVDSFEDDDLYSNAAYFLTTAAMKMHSDEIKEEQE